MTREPILRDAHDGAHEAEAEHREAHDKRAEMRPTADREDPHDRDLQRNHGAGLEAHPEIDEEVGCLASVASLREDGAAHLKARIGRERAASRYLLWVPTILSPSSLVKGTKGTMRPL